MTACWAIGYFGLSFVWVALLIALYMFKTRVWARKEQQRENLRNVSNGIEIQQIQAFVFR
jgi:hypothetical protein